MKTIHPKPSPQRSWLTSLSLVLLATVVNSHAGQGPQPGGICNRACWVARAPTCGISQMSALNRAIIHHTAGASDYSTDLNTSKAKVRGVQNIHINNGWCDIAYHFLVDGAGNIFEGRSGSMSGLPRGTHDSFNSNSFGFNMLGYFHPPYNHPANSTLRNRLYDVIAWRMPSAWSPYGAGTYNGVSVGTLDGHRKVKATACPGDGMWPYIGDNRSGGEARDSVNCRKNGTCGGGPAPVPSVLISRKADFNGDGKTDIVTFNRGSLGDAWVSLSTGNGFTGSAKWHDAFCFNGDLPSVGDVNGDGKDDLIGFNRDIYGDVWVALSTGSGFGAAAKWNDWFCHSGQIPAVGDVNGDGKDDVIAFSRGAEGDVYVSLSTGSGFGPSGLWHTWFCHTDQIPATGDFNGDGKVDIAAFSRGTTGDVWVSLSSGSGFGAAGLWSDWFTNGDQIPAVGDFNGDGKADIASFTRGTSGDVWVSLSGGSNFLPSSMWSDWFCNGDQLPGCGDFNGDGKDDMVVFTRGTEGHVWIAVSTGSGLLGSSMWTGGFCFGGELPLPASAIW